MAAFSGEKIVVVDDDEAMRTLVSTYLEELGAKPIPFSSPARALMAFKQDKWDDESTSNRDLTAVLCDIQMPEIDGLEFVTSFKRLGLDLPIILVTAYGTLDTAIQALRAGAFDYLTKPLQPQDFKVALERAIKMRHLQRENTTLREEVKKSWSFSSIIGKSPAIKNLFDLVQKVAPTNANVLITGESGTGKELVARAIHQSSSRADKPFIPLNCSAIPEALLESELFGHSKGSFTGAVSNRRGLFEEAEGGTIFLDEIGDLDISLQAKLLRVLQEKKIKPVGENKYKSVDVRILAATHVDLKNAIRENKFREDLYYRLSVIPVHITALRDRQEDIPILADHFLRKFAATHGVQKKEFSKKAIARLLTHKWEGNVRELENVIERAVILGTGDVIEEQDIQLPELTKKEAPLFDDLAGDLVPLEELENRYIRFVLDKTAGTKEKAARILGIDRKTLYRKEKELGLS